ncbi:DUF736 family protein [Hyphococcus sp.]|uniref:DUF736 family protein n=1 Tax=Hyphococcus sp. TaxID=2038636 RepID=UPI003CCBC14D
MTLKNVGKSENDSAEDIQGTLTSLAFAYPIRVARDNDELDSSYPTHKIYLRPQGREYVCVGSGWEKTIKHGPNAGKTMISCRIEDPSFEKPLDFALFEDEPGEWTVRWSRARQDNE